MVGVIWAIGAAVIFSLGHIAIRKGVGELGVKLGTAVMLVLGTAVVMLLAFLLADLDILLNASLAGIVYFAAAGLVHFIGGWGFMNASTRLVGAARMSAITGVTPLFAAALAMLTLQERPNLLISTGIGLIVIGAYWIARS